MTSHDHPTQDLSTNAAPSAAGATLNRRGFSAGLVGVGAALATPAIAQGRAKLVVVGGGAGGATIARYVAKDAKNVDVTLINATPDYKTCFFSNLYLVGVRSMGSLTHSYEALKANHGVNVVIQQAVEIDRAARRVRLGDGSAVAYDRLALSPGIDFATEALPGYDAAAQDLMPHAYQAGYQSFVLKKRLEAMREGGVFVLAPPPNPYRCPPGPYERASMAAKLFTRINPRAKIIILDAKDAFAKQKVFIEGWEALYPGMIEWVPAASSGGGVAQVDARSMVLETAIGDRVKADAASVIPPQRAGAILTAAGLTVDGWAPVDGASMRSTIDPNVYVVGDSSKAGAMPKSGFAANSQAHVAALAIRADLDGATLFPARYRNTCWSFLDHQNVVKVGANYAVKDGQIVSTASFSSQEGEDKLVRFENTLEANSWYASITADMFS